MGLTLLKAGRICRARQGVIHDEWERMGGKGTARKCMVKAWAGSSRGEQGKEGWGVGAEAAGQGQGGCSNMRLGKARMQKKRSRNGE